MTNSAYEVQNKNSPQKKAGSSQEKNWELLAPSNAGDEMMQTMKVQLGDPQVRKGGDFRHQWPNTSRNKGLPESL